MNYLKQLYKDYKYYIARNNCQFNEVYILGLTLNADTYLKIRHPISYIRGFYICRNIIWPTGRA